jgi:sugar lactone lactonase YvrE
MIRALGLRAPAGPFRHDLLHVALCCIGLCLLAGTEARAHPGVGIVMDSRGNVYYTDLAQVWKISPSGAKSVAVHGVHTHELYVDAKDNLYGEHLWYEGDATKKWGHRIWRLSADGRLVDVIPARGGFLWDYTDFSFVRDALGDLYWVDQSQPTAVKIKKRSPDGTVSDLCKGCVFSHVGWMTAARDGTLYLIDGSEVRRIGPDGQIGKAGDNLAEIRGSRSDAVSWHLLMGMTTDGEGNLYVAAYGIRKVKKVAPDGTVSVAALSSWPWSPSGVLIAPDGALWILESTFTNRVHVRRVQKDGTARSY